MPVSSPSYFPPARSDGTVVGQTAGNNATGDRCFLALDDAGLSSTINDLIILGDHAGDAGLTDTELAGTVVIGNSAASALTLVNANSEDLRPNVIAGISALALAVNAGGCVVIGAGALAAFVGNVTDVQHAAGGLVVIGTDALGAANPIPGAFGGPQNSVVIGSRAAYGTSGTNWNLQRSVVIGHQACEQTGGGQISTDVVIGYRAGRGLGNATLNADNNVLIGANCASAQASIRSQIAIGSGIVLAFSSGFDPQNGVVIGSGSSGGGFGGVLIGASITGPGTHNCLIGYAAHTGLPAGFAHTLSIASDTHRAIYVDAARGATVLGDSIGGGTTLTTPAGGTNWLKLMNGTIGTSNPVNGGYFYVSAGALHWVGSAGTDTVVAPA